MKPHYFQKTLTDWYHQNYRSFPWRETTDPYAIMVSEFMLQQTQTKRVLPKYHDFLDQFPTLESLAYASFPKVLRLWQGLGYNRRAQYLHDAVKRIVTQYGALVPDDIVLLQSMPGIGAYTARAITTFAFNQPQIFIETNIRTVYLYFFFKGQTAVTDKQILEKIELTLDTQNPRHWYYALMDYGVMLKQTLGNLNNQSRHYTKQSRFKGSNRQLRGQIVKALVDHPLEEHHLFEQLAQDQIAIETALEQLIKERLIVRDQSGIYRIPT